MTAICTGSLTWAEIQFNKRLKAMDVSSSGQVTVEFEDGSQATGSCVIGSDGSKSRVRTYLCGDKGRPVETGITMINHVATYTPEQAMVLRMHHPIVKLTFSSRGEIGLLAGKGGEVQPKRCSLG